MMLKTTPNYASKVNFTSKIMIQSHEEYRKSTTPEFSNKSNYIGLANRDAKNQPYTKEATITRTHVYTDDIKDCSAGGIINNKKVTLFHLNPRNPDNMGHTNTQKIKDVLVKEADITPNKPQNLKGLITGGIYIPGGDDRSDTLFTNMRSLLDSLKVKTSILWGQRTKNKLSIRYSAADDTWFINSTDKISDLADLKKAFKYIKIADGDELFINGNQIAKSLIGNTRFF